VRSICRPGGGGEVGKATVKRQARAVGEEGVGGGGGWPVGAVTAAQPKVAAWPNLEEP
jgi:hypothetical protein